MSACSWCCSLSINLLISVPESAAIGVPGKRTWDEAGVCDQLYRPKMESFEEILASMRTSNWFTFVYEFRLMLKLL